VLDRLAAFAARAPALIENRAKRVRTSVPKDATAQKSSTVVSDGQHHGSLLIVELGKT
jgi:hypothetical protein